MIAKPGVEEVRYGEDPRPPCQDGTGTPGLPGKEFSE